MKLSDNNVEGLKGTPMRSVRGWKEEFTYGYFVKFKRVVAFVHKVKV